MDQNTWKKFQEAIEEGQEISFDYKNEEWWISRVGEERSFLLTRSSDSYTQSLQLQRSFIKKELLMGKSLYTGLKIYKNE